MGAIVVVDALWGDAGKGKVAAFLARREGAALCVRAGVGTNAGHSAYLDEQRVVRTRQLPLAFLHEPATVAVGSGVAVDPGVFLEEVGRYGLAGRAKVDYRCPVITAEHVRREREDRHLAETVGSTASGSGAAQADFVLRRAQQARDVPALAPYLADVAELANTAAESGTVVVEGAQGTLLSLALSPDYPFVTSGNCTVAAAADDVGLSWRRLAGAVLVVKAVPSRVGAGPLPDELPPEAVEAQGIAERGVVTGRARRKAAGIPWDLLRYAALLNGPTEVALTFCDHYDPAVTGATARRQLTAPVWALIERVEAATGAPVTLVETGKRFEHLVDLRSAP